VSRHVVKLGGIRVYDRPAFEASWLALARGYFVEPLERQRMTGFDILVNGQPLRPPDLPDDKPPTPYFLFDHAPHFSFTIHPPRRRHEKRQGVWKMVIRPRARQ
jgi:hypothetical protein